MARNKKAPPRAWPRVELEGELVGYFATLESGKLGQVRQLLDDMLTEKERARNNRRGYLMQIYRLHFCGGGNDWQGDADLPGVMNGGVTLEFWPDGVALRFAPFFAKPLEGVDDGEV